MTWRAPAPSRVLRDSAPLEHWVAAGREILGRHGVLGEPRMAATGSDVVLDAGDVFVKLTSPEWAWQIESEVRCGEALGGRLPAAVPSVIGHGSLDGWPYVATTRVPGRPLADVWPSLGDAERRAVASDIGRFVEALRRQPAPPFGGSWGAFSDDVERHRVARQRTHGVAPERIEAAEVRRAAAAPPRAASLGWLHTELLGDHLFVERGTSGWRLTGAIDWADARAGHPDYEVAALVEFVFRGAAGCLEAFLEATGEPAPGAERRADLFAWALRHRYLHLDRLWRAAGEPPTLREVERILYG